MRDFEKIFLELEKDTTDPYMNKNLIQELVCCNKELLKLLDNETGNSLLHQAIIYGHYDMALFFIHEGANVNQQNSKNKNTALHLTEGMGLFEILLDSWADIHAVNNRGDTVLMTQVENRSYEIIDILLKEKIDINVPSKSGNNAAHMIMYDVFNDDKKIDKQQDIELLGKFISYDKNIIYSLDKKGSSILSLALDHGLLSGGCSFLPDKIPKILIAGHRSRIIAFAMGSSKALGERSWVQKLPSELIQSISQQSIGSQYIPDHNTMSSRGI